MIVKINNIIISLIISTSYLYPNTPSISIESKYGEGEKKDAITYEGLGNYYYNETIMDMNFNFDYGEHYIYLYAQLEYSRPPLKGFNFTGLNNYHLEYSSNNSFGLNKIKIGDIYTLYGRGLAINMFQDHQIDYDNSLKGIETSYYIDESLTLFFLAGSKKDFWFRFNTVEEEPSLKVENYAYMFGVEKNSDNWGNFHYLLLNKESILDHDEHEYLDSFISGKSGFTGQDTLLSSEHNLSWDINFFDTDFYIEKSFVNYSTLDENTANILKDHKGSKLYLSIYKDIFDFGITYEYKSYWTPNYLRTLSNAPIVYRESVSSLASRNSHEMDWNDEVGHQLNIDKYMNDMFSFEFNLSMASKHKPFSEESTFGHASYDMLVVSPKSFSKEPFKQFYIGSSGSFLNNKLYYKIGYDNFIQLKQDASILYYTKAFTIPSLFTLTMGENSITTYIERQVKVINVYEENNSEYSSSPIFPDSEDVLNYFSLTASYKGKVSLSFFHEDENQLSSSTYNTWTGYDLTANINPTTQLSFFFGDQKGGLVCANGVCAVQPDLNDGFKLTFRTLF